MRSLRIINVSVCFSLKLDISIQLASHLEQTFATKMARLDSKLDLLRIKINRVFKVEQMLSSYRYKLIDKLKLFPVTFGCMTFDNKRQNNVFSCIHSRAILFIMLFTHPQQKLDSARKHCLEIIRVSKKMFERERNDRSQ